MRLIHIPLAAAAFYIGLSVSTVPAQQNPTVAPAQLGQGPNADQQRNAPADPQGHDRAKSMQGGKEEPGSHQSGAGEAAFVNGKLNVPDAWAADSQTVPAKFSKHNAEIDAILTMAMPLGLTDEQKHAIAESVAKANAPVESIEAKVADMLPLTTQAVELSKDITDKIPAVDHVKAIRTKDRVLLVRPANMTVIDEIKN